VDDRSVEKKIERLMKTKYDCPSVFNHELQSSFETLGLVLESFRHALVNKLLS